jgi:hypothetical protein
VETGADAAVNTTRPEAESDRDAVRPFGSGSAGAGIEFNCVSVRGIGFNSGSVAGLSTLSWNVFGGAAFTAGAASMPLVAGAGLTIVTGAAPQDEQLEAGAPYDTVPQLPPHELQLAHELQVLHGL